MIDKSVLIGELLNYRNIINKGILRKKHVDDKVLNDAIYADTGILEKAGKYVAEEIKSRNLEFDKLIGCDSVYYGPISSYLATEVAKNLQKQRLVLKEFALPATGQELIYPSIDIKGDKLLGIDTVPQITLWAKANHIIKERGARITDVVAFFGDYKHPNTWIDIEIWKTFERLNDVNLHSLFSSKDFLNNLNKLKK
jgi:hypothetical protein